MFFFLLLFPLLFYFLVSFGTFFGVTLDGLCSFLNDFLYGCICIYLFFVGFLLSLFVPLWLMFAPSVVAFFAIFPDLNCTFNVRQGFHIILSLTCGVLKKKSEVIDACRPCRTRCILRFAYHYLICNIVSVFCYKHIIFPVGSRILCNAN